MSDFTPLTQPTLSEQELFDYCRTLLGWPIIEVEIDICQFRRFFQNAIDKYSRLIPKLRWFSIPAFAGIQEYELPRDTIGYGVTEVLIPRLDPIAPLLLSSGPRLDIFGYRYSYPYRDINELFIDQFYFKEASRILSAEFDWEYLDGALRIYPKPDEPFPLTYASAFPRDINSIPADDQDWFRTYLLAQMQIAVGHIRRKFSVPGAQTGQQLDGREMVQEGMLALAAAEKDLMARTPPFPLYRT